MSIALGLLCDRRRRGADRGPVADRLLRPAERLVHPVRDGRARRDAGQAADGPAGRRPRRRPADRRGGDRPQRDARDRGVPAAVLPRRQQAAEGTADTFLVIFSLLWSGIFLFFPLFNRDRLRIGDIVAGTWVVRTHGVEAVGDLVGSAAAAAPDLLRGGAQPLRHLRAADAGGRAARRAARRDRHGRPDHPRQGRDRRRRRRLRLPVRLLRRAVRQARGAG